MHELKYISRGPAPGPGIKVLIMNHGRGASAEDILSLSANLRVEGFSIIAPQATNNTWYPYSFLVPPAENEPWLSSALSNLKKLTEELTEKGTRSQDIYMLGFSQGACLTLEFAARNAAKFGGFVAFTGGLIGDQIYTENYTGSFEHTPVFIGTSDPDPHVPVKRVNETESILKSLGANVQVKIYKQMGHTVSADEINLANEWVFLR